MSNLQLEYTPEEILADHAVTEPLRVGGVVCHGGFDENGNYVSPRTRFRTGAIAAWQQSHRETFGADPMDVPLETWPGNYPNLEQARLLLREGVRDPIIASLTRIGTVEGFGAMIRYLAPADMQRHFVEDIRGTATEHLGRGLVEAHARDEAGWEEQAGHDRMWFAVRDIAFENPVTADQTQLILQRMGLSGRGGTQEDRTARFQAQRLFHDLDLGLEMLLSTMVRVLFIEIKAFHVFAWAEALLSDTGLVAGEGEAARLVSYIRADETPHVGYLRTSLTEMRDRTFIGESGRRYPGREVVGRLWDKGLEESLGILEEQNRTALAQEVALALAGHRRGSEVLDEFHALGDWRPADPTPASAADVPSGY
ncbi:MAG TPA: hypothetical protein VFA11_11330 [Acidimicrobiales bacterium]|nr:hypothetical protein [Acidimicrobiales bacterium]